MHLCKGLKNKVKVKWSKDIFSVGEYISFNFELRSSFQLSVCTTCQKLFKELESLWETSILKHQLFYVPLKRNHDIVIKGKIALKLLWVANK